MNSNKIKYLEKIEKVDETILLDTIPYPQANNVKQLFLFMKCLGKAIILDDELSNYLNISIRQVHYYGNALYYLGFCKRHLGSFLLTDIGIEFINSNKNNQIKLFIQNCFKIPSIRNCYSLKLTSKNFKIEDIMKILSFSNISITSNATLKRRSNTIMSWIKFIDSNINSLQ